MKDFIWQLTATPAARRSPAAAAVLFNGVRAALTFIKTSRPPHLFPSCSSHFGTISGNKQP